jgi:hypothetical protein
MCRVMGKMQIPLSPAMKSVLAQITGGQDWIYRPGVGWQARIFRALGDLGLVVQLPIRVHVKELAKIIGNVPMREILSQLT